MAATSTSDSFLIIDPAQLRFKGINIQLEIAGSEPNIMLIQINEVIPKAQVNPLSPAIFSMQGYNTYMNFEC